MPGRLKLLRVPRGPSTSWRGGWRPAACASTSPRPGWLPPRRRRWRLPSGLLPARQYPSTPACGALESLVRSEERGEGARPTTTTVVLAAVWSPNVTCDALVWHSWVSNSSCGSGSSMIKGSAVVVMMGMARYVFVSWGVVAHRSVLTHTPTWHRRLRCARGVRAACVLARPCGGPHPGSAGRRLRHTSWVAGGAGRRLRHTPQAVPADGSGTHPGSCTRAQLHVHGCTGTFSRRAQHEWFFTHSPWSGGSTVRSSVALAVALVLPWFTSPSCVTSPAV